MSARDLIHRALTSGITILAEDGDLVLRGDESAIASLVPEAKAHKAELLRELTRLPEDLESQIDYVAAFHGFTPDELREAKEIAGGDVENALTSFQALADEINGHRAEPRRQRVLATLEKSQGIKYALLTDMDSDPVLLTLAIRGKAACEFQIPREKYDGVLLLELLERHGGTVH